MARSTEEIQADIDEVQADLNALLAKAPYFVMHGNVVDNRPRIADLKFQLKELRAELRGQNPLQGPDLIV